MFDVAEAILNYGKELAFSDTEGGAYTVVDGLTSLSLGDRTFGTAEITNDQSPDRTKQYVLALLEAGKLDLKYRYGASAFEAVETIFQLGTSDPAAALKWWRVTLVDGAIFKFQGYLIEHNLPMDDLEGSPEVEGSIKISGALSFTPFGGS